MRPVLLAAIGLLLAPGVAGWNQVGGDGGRSTVLEPPPGTLDVVAVQDLGALGTDASFIGRSSPYLVWHDGRLWGVLAQGSDLTPGSCLLVDAPADNGAGASPLPMESCSLAIFQGVWVPTEPVNGDGELFIVCMKAGVPNDPDNHSGVLAAYNRTGRLRWSFDPLDHFWDVAPELDPVEAILEDQWRWSCDGTAIHKDFLYVPFHATRIGADGSKHRIAKIPAATGDRVEWQSEVTASSFAGTGTVAEGARQPVAFIPLTVSANDAGVAVSGAIPCSQTSTTACRSPTQDGESFLGAMAWFNADGRGLGVQVPQPLLSIPGGSEDDPVESIPLVSSYAAANGAAGGEVFIAQAGHRVIVIDPRNAALEDEKLIEVRETGQSPSFWPAPLWQGSRIAVPTDRIVTFLDPVSYDPIEYFQVGATWATGDSTQRIVDLAGDRLDRLFILTAQLDSPAFDTEKMGTTARLAVVDADGRTEHELTLRGATTKASSDSIYAPPTASTTYAFGWVQAPRFTGIAGGLAVTDAKGHLFIIGDRQEEPTVDAPDLYPKRGERFEMTIAKFGNPAEVLVRWGDEPTTGRALLAAWPENATSMTLEHLYSKSEVFDATITVVDDDGTTATTELVVRVGEEPDPELNAIQKAFGPEYRDTTWGIIGLVVALIGTIYAWARIQRSRSRVRSALGRLHQIREQGLTDPLGALKELQELRREVQDRSASGFYDHGQVQILETHMARTARSLMLGTVAPFRDRMDPWYRSLLVGFFEDGRIGDQEQETALEALGKQKQLTTTERTLLRDMFAVLKN